MEPLIDEQVSDVPFCVADGWLVGPPLRRDKSYKQFVAATAGTV